ncbi:MAG TPA: SufD family Fe-S cluster assembly protein [Candidatus Limnocylindrales bacterium]|nr:SufD family Fe-S cluster assembly protein [Candidatus Limnocylindrales bacterium]
MTEVADPSSRPRPARAPRRSPTELAVTFLDRPFVEALVAERGEPGWLRDDRLAALTAFESLEVESNRLYTPYLDLRAARIEDAAPYTAVAVTPTGTGDLPAGVAALVEIREDGVAAVALDEAARAAGVRVLPLAALVRTDEVFARSLLDGGSILPADEKLAQLSRAAWSQGIVVHIPANVRVERPIVLRWAVGAARTLVGRTFIVLDDGAQASVVEELVQSDEVVAGAYGLLSATTEIRLGANARLAMASLQELGPDHVAFQQRLARIGEGADLRWALAQLGARLVRSRVDNVLAGDRSTVEQVEIVFGIGDQLHDLTSYTRHQGRDTTGQLLAKGVLMDNARSYMKGLISIEKTAIGTDSYLGEFGMNLSKHSRAVAIPSLEIDQPDCRRAMHSSSVGPIDESQLFYLESRGIAPDEARKFIVLGFLEPVVARVPLEDAQDRLREALEAKWAAGIGIGTIGGGSAAA